MKSALQGASIQYSRVLDGNVLYSTGILCKRSVRRVPTAARASVSLSTNEKMCRTALNAGDDLFLK